MLSRKGLFYCIFISVFIASVWLTVDCHLSFVSAGLLPSVLLVVLLVFGWFHRGLILFHYSYLFLLFRKQSHLMAPTQPSSSSSSADAHASVISVSPVKTVAFTPPTKRQKTLAAPSLGITLSDVQILVNSELETVVNKLVSIEESINSLNTTVAHAMNEYYSLLKDIALKKV